MENETEIKVSFGDCDPAGIAFYPNFFRWFDAVFHDWLDQYGGHDLVCCKIGAKGIGLMDASAQFARPVRNGELLCIKLFVEKWGSKSLHLRYEGAVSDRKCIEGREVRGVFKISDGKLFAAEMQPLCDLMGNGQNS